MEMGKANKEMAKLSGPILRIVDSTDDRRINGKFKQSRLNLISKEDDNTQYF